MITNIALALPQIIACFIYTIIVEIMISSDLFTHAAQNYFNGIGVWLSG